jgi:hypothetical protein
VVHHPERAHAVLLAEVLHPDDLSGLEPELLEGVAQRCGDAPWHACDVTDRVQVEASVEAVVAVLGGLDVVVANAGVAGQLPFVGGDPTVFERTIEVNVLGCYYTLRAAGPHISHANGYALAVSSLAAAVHLPLLGAYSASKAATEALTGVTPLGVGIDALERGIARRAPRICAPAWVARLLRVRMLTQPLVDRYVQRHLPEALAVARTEDASLTTAQPARAS